MKNPTVCEGFDLMPDVAELRFLTEGIHVIEDLKTSFLVQCPNATHIKVEKIFNDNTGALVEYRLIPLESKSVVKGSTVRKEGTSGLGLVTEMYGAYCIVQWGRVEQGDEEVVADLQVVTQRMRESEREKGTDVLRRMASGGVTAQLNEPFTLFSLHEQ